MEFNSITPMDYGDLICVGEGYFVFLCSLFIVHCLTMSKKFIKLQVSILYIHCQLAVVMKVPGSKLSFMRWHFNFIFMKKKSEVVNFKACDWSVYDA